MNTDTVGIAGYSPYFCISVFVIQHNPRALPISPHPKYPIVHQLTNIIYCKKYCLIYSIECSKLLLCIRGCKTLH